MPKTSKIRKSLSSLKAVAILGTIALVFYWIFWGRTLVIETRGADLSKIVNLSYFEVLHPDMSRSEIDERMGQPTRIDVPYVENDDSGSVVYAEIRWIYERSNAQLNYYVEENDTPGGSVEYIPEKMRLSEFLYTTPQSLVGKWFIEIRDGKEKLIFIRLNRDNTIEKINWYNNN